jgi:hypothetical protein
MLSLIGSTRTRSNVAKVKKFDLKALDKPDWFSAVVHGKFRGIVQKSGRSNYALHLGKKDVTNFKTKKALETWLTEKWA